MLITELAEGTDAEHLGELIGFFGIPVAGVILLVLGFVGRAGGVFSRPEKSARVGQCITQADFQNGVVNAAPRDCADPDAMFEVAGTGGAPANCPDGKLEGSAYAILRKGSSTLCLMVNFKLGQCYSVSGTGEDLAFAPSDCTDSGLRVRVARRDDDSSDHSLCSSGTKAISYPRPARLYCLERLEN